MGTETLLSLGDTEKDKNGKLDGRGAGKHHLEPCKKRLRLLPSHVDSTCSLRSFLEAALPGKDAFIADWIRALNAPSVCISSLEDIKRLDPEDIGSLPVPPVVKAVFRDVLNGEAEQMAMKEAVLHATSLRKKEFLGRLRDRNMEPALAGSKYFQDVKNYRLILTQEEIQAGVRIVAKRIENWCKGHRIILVGILKGAYMFMSDLCRELVRPYSIYFVEASSYLNSRAQAGSVDIAADLPASKFVDAVTKVSHKIILVDELLDNGKTMQEMKEHFLKTLAGTHSEADILTVCMFSKKRARSCPEADITGIPNLPDLWLVGYGLDDRGTKRGWPHIFAMPKVKLVETNLKEEVDKLLEVLDDSCAMTAQFSFCDFELTFNQKQKHHLCGISVDGGQGNQEGLGNTMRSAQGGQSCSKLKKEDVMTLLAHQTVVKGKYDHALQFAFIQQDVQLVPEDSIFSGNKPLYADLRCAFRRHITRDAQRFHVEGIADVIARGS